MPEGTPIAITSVHGTIEALMGQKGHHYPDCPQGAFSMQSIGNSYSGQPELKYPVIKDDILLVAVMSGGNTTLFPSQLRMRTGPNSPLLGPPEVPPFADTDGWTVLGTATTDYSGQNIGGDCGIAYHPHGGICTAGILVGWAWKQVDDAEFANPQSEPTRPVQVSSEDAHNTTSVWLWNLGQVDEIPSLAATSDGHSGSFTATMPALSGNTATLIGWATSAGHSGVIQPTGFDLHGGSPIQLAMNDNYQTLPPVANAGLWAGIQQNFTGGAAEQTIQGMASGYTGLNWAGVSIQIPDDMVFSMPNIPYPANQTDNKCNE